MSCSVCAGYSSDNCPCCSDNAQMVECPDCDGTGVYYYAFNTSTRKMSRVTELVFSMLPVDEDDARDSNTVWCQGYVEPCSTCHGEGEIPEDY